MSTHSPLVVGSAGDAELVHLSRYASGIVPEPVNEDFGGWRSDQILTGPAFGLTTTRDPRTQERLETYARLTEGGLRTEDQRRRARELADELHQLLPPPHETPAARQAASIVSEALDQRLREIPVERRREVAEEARRYLLELQRGGSSS